MTGKIISSNSMNEKNLQAKNKLLRELLQGISIEDLQMLVDYKKKMQTKPIPTPRKSVNQMAHEYEQNIIMSHTTPVPAIRKKRATTVPPSENVSVKQIPVYTAEVKQINPIKLPRTIINETNKALKGFTSSYEININNSTDPLLQLQNTRVAVGYHIKKSLSAMKGIKFIESLKITLWKPQDDGWIYKTAYFNSKPQTIINDNSINEALQLTKQQILNFIAIWISEGSGWTIESVNGHYLNIV